MIRDGAEAISPLLGKYGPCASGSLTFFSSGKFAFLQMVSSVFRVNDKLRIAFKPTDLDGIDCSNGENPPNLCGLNTYLGETPGVVSSPNFPNNYGANRNCLWTIIAPPGYRVQFTIQWLGIEDHRYSRPGSCGDDSITISEYRGNYTNDVTVLCGCKRLFTFVSFMEKMWVKFSSYKKNNWPGFYATYKFLAPEECPAGETNCSLTSTDVVGFDAQGQVCRASVKTTTKVTNQETTSLLPSPVNSLARLVSLASTPALEITTSVHLTFSESNRWQTTTAVEIKKLRTVSSNTFELATFVPSPSSFTNQTLKQARSSFTTVDDNNGTLSHIGQIKTPWDVSTSTKPASDGLGTKQTIPVVPTRSLAPADLVIPASKREDFSSEGLSVKPSKASKESPSAQQTTPVERPTTQYIPVTRTDNPVIGLEVKCTHYAMEVTISRFLRPHLVIGSLHLQDPACKVSFINDTHAFLSAPLDGCGTQQNTSEDYFIYFNTMTGDEKSPKASAEITRKGRLKFEFQCSFRKLHVLSIVSYSPRRKAVRTSDDGVGNFTFEMDMFKDSKYEIVVNQYPVTLYSGQSMYFQVNVKSRDRSLLSFLEECWVTPTTDPRDQTRHILIKQGCSHDSSLRYVYKKSSVQKFTFQAFRFRDVFSESLYMHCNVVTCRRSDTGSVCDRGCKKDRRHRRENKRFIMDKDVFLSLGPVKFQDQGEVPESYDSGNITLDSEAKIQVDCRPDYIEVSLQISDFPGLAVNDSVLHLEDKACVASYKEENMVKFTFGLEACMTTQEDDGKKIYYMNKVYLKAGQPADDEAITRVHTEIIPFKCGYDKKAVISKVSYSPRNTLVITGADGFGNFTYFMDMYEDESNNVTVTEFPKAVGLGQKMYFGFRVESGDSELVVFPGVCKATTSSSFDSTPVHLIIENACSRDNTLDYQYEKKAEQFFNLAAFRFKEGYDDVYIHCKLTVCRTDDTGSRCDRGCGENRRRRRSTEEDMSADLYVGPLKTNFMTSNEDAKEYNHSGRKSTDSMIMVVGVVVGVLGTVAIALIVAVVIISQRRKSTRKEETLVISDDS